MTETGIHTIEDAVEAYRDFFRWERVTNGKITVDDKPFEMHPLQAVGDVDDIGHMVEEASSMHPEEMDSKATRLYNAGFISSAFFYFFMGEMRLGADMDDIKEKGMERFHVAPIPYKVHQIHEDAFSDGRDHTYVFLDWDGTIELNGSNLRRKTADFLEFFREQNERLGWHKYVMIVTSASFDLAKKVMRHEDVANDIDAIYSVPGIGHTIHKQRKGGLKLWDGVVNTVTKRHLYATHKREDPRKIIGKLYTHICRKLGVNYRNAIILTDTWADKSVDKTYPITTIVTPQYTSAGAWIGLIKHFEGKGHDILSASSEIKRRADDTIGHSTRRGERHWKYYHMVDELYLLRNPDMPGSKDCYFLEQGQQPDRLPKHLRTLFR